MFYRANGTRLRCLMCGKATPFRRPPLLDLYPARPSLAAEKNDKAVSRKAGGFPHIRRQSRKSCRLLLSLLNQELEQAACGGQPAEAILVGMIKRI